MKLYKIYCNGVLLCVRRSPKEIKQWIELFGMKFKFPLEFKTIKLRRQHD